MPVAVTAVSAPLSDALCADLERIYVDYPTPAGPEAVLAAVTSALATGATLYTGMFNARHIAAILVEGQDASRALRYLAVHPATRCRGVASRLVDEVRRLEGQKGTEWLSMGPDILKQRSAAQLMALGFIPHGETEYRCRLDNRLG